LLRCQGAANASRIFQPIPLLADWVALGCSDPIPTLTQKKKIKKELKWTGKASLI